MATHEFQQQLLRSLSTMGSHGRAEGESAGLFAKTFYPVVEHARAFDPDVTLIVGPRGSGKSELFRAVIDFGLLGAIGRQVQSTRVLDSKRAKWVSGYPIGSEFPDQRGLARFIRARSDPELTSDIWFAYLARRLTPDLDAQAVSELAELNNCEAGDVAANYEALQKLGNRVTLALDRLDRALTQKDSYLFVAYDELDTLGGFEWDAMNRAIRGLIQFWSVYSRRWRRIRAKLFIRTDLYQAHGASGGADFAKLAANRAEILWSDANLFSLLLKRIANTSSELAEYCRKTIVFESDKQLGLIPRLRKAIDARPFVERLIGPYMGANRKKGLAFRWLLDHIRDGRGHALPRPLVRLVEQASVQQLNSNEWPRWPRLLEPTSLRRALDIVSSEHVDQSQHEWPWLAGLASRMKGEHVPLDAKLLERRLQRSWSQAWSAKDVRPPVDDAGLFIEYLVEVGVFRTRSKDKIDVPDLFLAGLGLKRKGGVRQS